eukprot:3567518-Pyramimonas_sp.AAC.1
MFFRCSSSPHLPYFHTFCLRGPASPAPGQHHVASSAAAASPQHHTLDAAPHSCSRSWSRYAQGLAFVT